MDPISAISLSAAHYLDRNLQEREVDRVLRHAWHPVARTQQLATNPTIECRLLNEPITIMRDGDTIRGWSLTGAEPAHPQQNRRESRSRLAVEDWNGFVMVNRDHDASPLAP
jgi:phenylpropionate dioxygenase-like ring-hydroxylating dioxygenase large terminal subunit